MRPVAWAPPVMRDGKNPDLLCANLMDDAVWEPTESISTTSVTEYRAKQRIGQDEIGRSRKLRHKRETKLSSRLQRIERGRIV